MKADELHVNTPYAGGAAIARLMLVHAHAQSPRLYPVDHHPAQILVLVGP